MGGAFVLPQVLPNCSPKLKPDLPLSTQKVQKRDMLGFYVGLCKVGIFFLWILFVHLFNKLWRSLSQALPIPCAGGVNKMWFLSIRISSSFLNPQGKGEKTKVLNLDLAKVGATTWKGRPVKASSPV